MRKMHAFARNAAHCYYIKHTLTFIWIKTTYISLHIKIYRYTAKKMCKMRECIYRKIAEIYIKDVVQENPFIFPRQIVPQQIWCRFFPHRSTTTLCKYVLYFISFQLHKCNVCSGVRACVCVWVAAANEVMG